MQIKPNKSLPRQGTGRPSFTERAAVSSLFLHRTSVVRVNLSRLIHNAADTMGQCPHHSKDPKEVGPKESHTKAHHNYITQD